MSTARGSRARLICSMAAAIAAVFIPIAPAARAGREGQYREFELSWGPDDIDGNTSTHVYVGEGDDFRLQIKWHDRKGNGSWHAAWGTKETSPVSVEDNDFAKQDREKHSKSRTYSTFNHTFQTNEDDIWEGHEPFEAGYDDVCKEDVTVNGTPKRRTECNYKTAKAA